MRVLAVAESDAYAKWSAWLLERAPATWLCELCLITSVISPTDRQLAEALTGTGLRTSTVTRHGIGALRRRIARDRPDAVVLAATGPTVAAITAVLPRRRPVVAAGLPGVALPVAERALRARRHLDVFITHSRRERRLYGEGFRNIGADTEVALVTLPFLGHRTISTTDATSTRPIFAAQPSVPASRAERVRALELIAALGPPTPLVKLRSGSAERLTHREPHPYPELWQQLVECGGADAGALEFGSGPLADVLGQASCLITVSSTAALEAIDAKRPVVIADDFGVGDRLLNEVFVGSGLVGPISRQSVMAAGAPQASWSHENYFHPPSDDDWIEVLERHVGAQRRRHRRSLDSGHLRAVRRGVVRVGAGQLRRRGRR
ncbi:MAG: hypothetical protein M3337_05090 [Actinomycetota bacterium]|nr:hypothetical protein [Actinomycetota bacterium]